MAELGYVHGSDMLVGLMVEEAFSPLGHSKTCTISNKAERDYRQPEAGAWDPGDSGGKGKGG